MSLKIRDASYELRDMGYKIAPLPADDSMVQHLDLSMIIECRPAPYIGREQLIIRHLHPADDSTVQVHVLSAGAGMISKLSSGDILLQGKVIMSSQLVVKILKPVFSTLVMVSF
jgi:hypothetical protein